MIKNYYIDLSEYSDEVVGELLQFIYTDKLLSLELLVNCKEKAIQLLKMRF